MDANPLLADEVRRIQESGILGEAKMRRLFDYLASKSDTVEAPKELTIAIEVFDKQASFDVGHDALVRVYVHKLRKTLDGFYSARPSESACVLHIPRGQYRLGLTLKPATPLINISPPAAPTAPSPASASAPYKGWRANIRVASTLGFGVLLGLSIATIARLGITPSELDRVRSSPLWSPLLSDNRPILIVVGDYYLIGETDDTMETKRLVREYDVNSKSDLDAFLKRHPEDAERYQDVALRYLPTSVAFALRNIMPVLGEGTRRVNIALESDLTPSAVKSMDVIYIGYLSGLGILQQITFAGSRFSVGQSFDELIDARTKHTYISQTAAQALGAPQGAGKEPSYRDYGMLASLRGPEGNTILIISGTRDEGVRQTAEVTTNPAKLAELNRSADIDNPFEALIEVSALDGVNLSGRVLLESKR